MLLGVFFFLIFAAFSRACRKDHRRGWGLCGWFRSRWAAPVSGDYLHRQAVAFGMGLAAPNDMPTRPPAAYTDFRVAYRAGYFKGWITRPALPAMGARNGHRWSPEKFHMETKHPRRVNPAGMFIEWLEN